MSSEEDMDGTGEGPRICHSEGEVPGSGQAGLHVCRKTFSQAQHGTFIMQRMELSD